MNFIPYTYKESLQTLIEMSEITPRKDKICYIFAGPNGSGKSTLITNLYKNNKLNCTYINADIIKYKGKNLTDQDAMKKATSQVRDFIENGYTFCYEMVLSHPSKIDLINSAYDNGYKIISTLVYTNSPQINCARVLLRFKQGGHNVPQDKIISRYYRSLENFKALEKISSEVHTFDNSQELISRGFHPLEP